MDFGQAIMVSLTADQFRKKYDIADIQELAVFGALNTDFINYLIEHGEILKASIGEIIYRQGEVPNPFLAIIEGSVSVYKGSLLRNQRVICLEPGECAGFICMFCMQPFMGDVVIKKDAVLLGITNDMFASLSNEYNEQFQILLMNLTRNIGRAYIKKV